MHSSSSRSLDSTNSDVHFERVLCKCGIELQLKNSWTPQNPGRRFWSCPKYNTGDNCGFFRWFDPEMCSRSKVLIPRFLKKLDRLEDEINDLKIKEKQLEAELRRAKGMELSLSLEMVELKSKYTKEIKKMKKNQKFSIGIIVMIVLVVAFMSLSSKEKKFKFLALM
ncbi:hypothetical protein OROMI_033981 [Orobanche minor]